MISYLFLVLWASCSFAMPASLSELSHLMNEPDQHDTPESLNVPSKRPLTTGLDSSSEEHHRKRNINNHPWVKTGAILNPRASGNATQDQQTATGQYIDLAKVLQFPRICETDEWKSLLPMDDMYSNVGIVVEDLKRNIRISSTERGNDLNEYITTWIYVDIHDKSCSGPGETRGGQLWMMHAGTKLANVVIYAVDQRDQ